jgi:APA family basic amino acid/polyamine antiporter
VASVYLAFNLPPLTWIRFAVWILIGLVVYRLYGRRHSRLSEGEAGASPLTGIVPEPALKKDPRE